SEAGDAGCATTFAVTGPPAKLCRLMSPDLHNWFKRHTCCSDRQYSSLVVWFLPFAYINESRSLILRENCLPLLAWRRLLLGENRLLKATSGLGCLSSSIVAA